MHVFYHLFFFQAEDGIRDYKVTGVQTCALPICISRKNPQMERQPMKRIAGTVLAGLMLLVVAWAQGALLINGAGATFPNPIYSKWFDEYRKSNTNVEINYQSVGSGAGIKQVTDGTVDFGASDGPMSDEQLKAFQEKHGF